MTVSNVNRLDDSYGEPVTVALFSEISVEGGAPGVYAMIKVAGAELYFDDTHLAQLLSVLSGLQRSVDAAWEPLRTLQDAAADP